MTSPGSRPIIMHAAWVVTAAIALVLALTASPAQARETYAGFATGSALHVDAATAQRQRALNIDVGIADAAVDESGLKKTLSEYDRPIVPRADSSLHSRARASVLDVGALLDPIEQQAQLAPFAVVSEAPGGDRARDSLLEQTIDPLIDLTLAERLAHARWNQGTCVLGEPISRGTQSLAQTSVLDTASTGNAFEEPLLQLLADTPSRAVTTIDSREQIFLDRGRGGLQSVVGASVAPVTFFEGTENEFTVEVGGPALLSAAASGRPGGADVIFRAPVVSLIQGGERTTVGPSEPTVVTEPPSGQPIAEVRIGTVDPLPRPKGLGNATESSDGTRAAAEVNVVEVTLLDVPDPRMTGATVAIGHLESSSVVPAGGIECGLPVSKHAQPPRVSVGDDFTAVITVTNPFACALEDITIADELTARSGAAFEIVRTRPRADQVSDGVRSTGGVRWDDLGRIEPGGEISVRVDTTAAEVGRIRDVAVAGGTLVGCATALPGADADDVSVLGKARAHVDGRGTLGVNVSKVLGRTFLPATGVGALVATAGGLLGAAALGGAWLLRRRSLVR